MMESLESEYRRFRERSDSTKQEENHAMNIYSVNYLSGFFDEDEMKVLLSVFLGRDGVITIHLEPGVVEILERRLSGDKDAKLPEDLNAWALANPKPIPTVETKNCGGCGGSKEAKTPKPEEPPIPTSVPPHIMRLREKACNSCSAFTAADKSCKFYKSRCVTCYRKRPFAICPAKPPKWGPM